jgi:hypothetical protein
MAKRYYNLEKETKESLKVAENLGLQFSFLNESVGLIDETVKRGKGLGIIYKPEDIIFLAGKPNFYTNLSNQFCYKNSSNGVLNLANPLSNANINLVNNNRGLKTDQYSGGVTLVNGQAGQVPFNFFGDNKSFTISLWLLAANEVGIYANGIVNNWSYQTNGFAVGINSSSAPWGTRSLYLDSSNNGGNTFLVTPNNSFLLNTPYYLTYVYDENLKISSIYLNGNISATRTNSIVLQREVANLTLNLNQTINATNYTTTFYSFDIYYRALSTQEIMRNYNLTKGKFGL